MPTLQELTRNNTSAADSFKGFPTLNVAAPGNVSKIPLPLAPKQKLLVHRCDWWGGPSHPDIGVSSTDPGYIAKTVNDMKERSIYAAVSDWYGQGSHEDKAALLMRAEAEKQGFKLSMCIDGGAPLLKKAADKTQAYIDLIGYLGNEYFPSPSYMNHTDGRPILTFFSHSQWKADWAKIRATLATWKYKPYLIFRNTGAFSYSYSDGAFSWTDPDDNFYQTGIAKNKIVIGSVNIGFNNTDRTIIDWGTPHKYDQRGGQRMLDQALLAAKYPQVPYVQLVTWNDYQEGSEVETGLDGIAISANISQNLLRWVLTGSPRVVDHFEVYLAQLGATDLRLVASVPPNMTSIDLARQLTPGSYQFYVRAVGIGNMKNAMSPQVKGQVALSLLPLP